MNLSSSSRSSLYQLTQEFLPSRQAITVSTATFKGVVKILVDLLLEQQLTGTVWLKLPPSAHWLEEIYRLRERGQLTHLCVCSSDGEKASFFTEPSPYQGANQLTPLMLETSSSLQREYFVIILSHQLQSLLLARQHLPEEDPQWQLVYSFDPALLELVLAQIKQDIIITDRTPEGLLRDSPPLPKSELLSQQANLVSALLLKHIQQSEENQKLINSSPAGQNNLNAEFPPLQFKAELLKNFAQEMSIPITNIKTALHLLDSRQSKREQRERYFELLQRECEKQNALLTAVQEFIQLDQLPRGSENYPRLEDLIPGIVSTYQPLAEERGISLGYTIPSGFPPVACPEPWLRQILLNLLNNSLKFTAANGRVYVQAISNQEQVEITVSDTGIGIEMSDIPKIFNSFYRGKNLATSQMNSAGLGLTVVKQLLVRCGGTIHVNSKLDRGTTFVLTLPVNLAPQP